MKFVVNRVHPGSIHYGAVEGIEGLEICMDGEFFGKSKSIEGYCRGHIVHGQAYLPYDNFSYAGAFTVAEIPDTEEGYYLL